MLVVYQSKYRSLGGMLHICADFNPQREGMNQQWMKERKDRLSKSPE